MKMIVCKILFCFLCFYQQLILLKIVILRLEFTLTFLKSSRNKHEILLTSNFDLSEMIGKTVTKKAKF